MKTSNQTSTPGIDLERVSARLESIRQALGAQRVGVARRLSGARSAERVYEVLAVAGSGHEDPDPARRISLALIEEVMRQGTPCAIAADRGRPAWDRRLQRWDCWRIEAWPFPSDRLPSVFFVAHFESREDPGERRRWVARTGMDALARAIAPPTWAPLAELPPARGQRGTVMSLREAVHRFECSLIERALQDAEGNKTEAARQLRMSRQGLYRKLHAHGLMDPEDRGQVLDSGAASA